MLWSCARRPETGVGLLLVSCTTLALSGVPGLFMRWRSSLGQKVANLLVVLASLVGLGVAFQFLVAGSECRLNLPCPLPGATFDLGIDALSAFFLVPIYLMAALGSIYGLSYWRQEEHPSNGRMVRAFWGVLAAGLGLLVLARDAFPFLLGWECMALGSFFLIATENREEEVRRASWIYFVATHVGTLCLFAMFILMRGITGSFTLRPLVAGEVGVATMTWIFALALVTFGLKAGLMPFHIWLPPAHANAPSHVSALMSGVVIKMGVYGLVRFTGYLPSPPVGWGVVVLVLGVISGVLGVAFALGQHDLKRLLAYHSVENIGIIAIGLGLAMLGRVMGHPEWILLGLAGGLLHVWNHGLFKALLFLSAGAVVHGVRTREIDHMGGLARAMPFTAFFFLVGAVAICGLPPLNGFVSELLIYIGLFGTIGSSGTMVAMTAPCLALIGALAVACFVKAYGAVFLGMPRTSRAARAHEVPWSMRGPMVVLAVCCATIGLAPQFVAPLLENAVRAWAHEAGGDTLTAHVPLAKVSVASTLLLGVIVIACAMVWRGMRRQAPVRVGTWDCGYARPTARMQYTASSFAQMIVSLFAWVLRPRTHRPTIRGAFPAKSEFTSHVDDVVLESFIVPTWDAAVRRTRWVRNLQQGLIHHYILYVLLALFFLLLAMVPFKSILLKIFWR